MSNGDPDDLGHPISELGRSLFERYFLIEQTDKTPDEDDGDQPPVAAERWEPEP